MRKICYFGIYDRKYPRNNNIIESLKFAGVEVVEINNTEPGKRKYLDLIKRFWKVRNEIDLTIIGFPGQLMVPIAKILSRKPVILDLHVSYYDSIILQRLKHSKFSVYSVFYYLLDFIACHLADAVLMDSNAHSDYIARTFKLNRKKVITVYTGFDFAKYNIKAEAKNNNEFLISYHGHIQKINGFELVIEAVKELSDVKVKVVGLGPEIGRMMELVKEAGLEDRIFFLGAKPFDELLSIISQADLSLGFFRKNDKVDRVIPNKVYESIAVGLPIITTYSSACAEIFTDKEHIIYCDANNVPDLVEKIRWAIDNKAQLEKMSTQAYSRLQEISSPDYLSSNLINNLRTLYER